MGFFNRLFGRSDQPDPRQQQPQSQGYGQFGNRPQEQLTDEQAIERYRYMLRTAPPETIEQAHEEAFSRLTPEQRRTVLQELTNNLPPQEQAAGVQYRDDPRSLARMATRAEIRQPGTLERTFSGMSSPGIGMGMGGGIGLGGFMGGSFLSTMAGVVAGSLIADAFFGHSGYGYDQGYGQGYDQGYTDANAQDNVDAQGVQDQGAGYDTSNAADYSGTYDSGYGGASSGSFGDDAAGSYGNDMGGDMGSDFGGDFGGGDFGGDFGGGDF
ncbi:MAG: hypothetical protein ACJ78Q_01965 [Chloroflexia bacterium]|jgi:hypothetical protein